eukprot:jgi/Botrbrau1/193/Bobra.0022s0173.1
MWEVGPCGGAGVLNRQPGEHAEGASGRPNGFEGPPWELRGHACAGRVCLASGAPHAGGTGREMASDRRPGQGRPQMWAAALIPLLEARKLPLPHRGQSLTASPGFQLLASVTCTPSRGGTGSSREILAGLWATVRLPPLLPEEEMQILRGAFPDLRPLLGPALDTLRLCQDPSRVPRRGTAPGTLQGIGGTLGTSGRHHSLRDLFKWCRRMLKFHGELLHRSLRARGGFEGTPAGPAALALAVREAAFAEALDVFAAAQPNSENRRRLAVAIGEMWALSEEIVDRRLALIKPAVTVEHNEATIGRVTLPVQAAGARPPSGSRSGFAHTGCALRCLEAVAAAVAGGEAVLLVGETGCGKTSLLQHLASMVGAKLVVLNLSQQSDSSDLLGGFRPVEAGEGFRPLAARLPELLLRTYPKGAERNRAFVTHIAKLTSARKWVRLVEAFREAIKKVEETEYGVGELKKLTEGQEGEARPPKKRKLDDQLRAEWRKFSADVDAAERAADAAEGGFAFAFVEGALVTAIREGAWLLLDEFNLAPPEVLDRVACLLEGEGTGGGSLTLVERGDSAPLPRHSGFRLLAAMNPATDAGKKDLPATVRNRMTEIFVHEPSAREDLRQLVLSYLQGTAPSPPADAVVDFYIAAKAAEAASLQDGAGARPAYNLRTLCRALEYARAAAPIYGLPRALYDGGAMSFSTQLAPPSAAQMDRLLRTHLLEKEAAQLLKRVPAVPHGPAQYVLFEKYWVEVGEQPIPDDSAFSNFVTTNSVKGHLQDLARAVLLRRYPILLQGPTSSGKTSLVAHLAAKTGHRCIRINNHEQTDLQEYLGSYVADAKGRLVFREGALVTALRRGHWVVLDELNLAPTEVLEALNRLLDSNRALFVPELQEEVRPHPHFMLFATQNPAGAYGGRKPLSRAFRSRFLELQVADIPDGELAEILTKRCCMAPSRAKCVVSAMHELQRRRQVSNVFAGKHGFITPRDLFKWAGRGSDSYQGLAEDGFMLLGERLRSPGERATVLPVLETELKVKLDVEGLYEREGEVPVELLRKRLREACGPGGDPSALAAAASLSGIVWTRSMRRMYTLLDRCLQHAEPALLVGETGTGKTTVCQLAAFVRGQRLHIFNCNQHTEAADFLGGFRPTRERERARLRYEAAVETLTGSDLPNALGLRDLQRAVSSTAGGPAAGTSAAEGLLTSLEQQLRAAAHPSSYGEELERLRKAVEEMQLASSEAGSPFQWVDGPLIVAMRQGDIILLDELNLAEDAVLERLNSVLEGGRSITLAEKGGAGAEEIVAAPGFRIVATMNPGGDYGKRELSPALANRFTAIWVPAIDDPAELRAILEARLHDEGLREQVAERLLGFWQFFRSHPTGSRLPLSVRDLLAWADFIVRVAPKIGVLPSYVHGAHLVLLDGIGLGTSNPSQAADELREECRRFLAAQLPQDVSLDDVAGAWSEPSHLPTTSDTPAAAPLHLAVSMLDVQGSEQLDAVGIDMNVGSSPTGPHTPDQGHDQWGIPPFYIDRGVPRGETSEESGRESANAADRRDGASSDFNFKAPATARNACRVLRALQLRKAVLLEGSPGVGKTSLVAGLAAAAGHKLVRINLSEQTDMMDLLGADLPSEGGLPARLPGPTVPSSQPCELVTGYCWTSSIWPGKACWRA